ncbi:Hypothetical_protein [Hexamita inflata]|uniref:Hypothetical_protein n=1 Tax=Hexamita inflata TaxID=28002 RepID=A0AA86RSY6_9EUKA|nr:Hypothetical protein HINF_LOCUS65049 [Hexamita inflata]
MMCKKNPYFCVLAWFCLLFLSMIAAGIALCVIPIEYKYPIYSGYISNGYISYYMSSNDVYQNVGLGVTLCVVGFFGFFITISFSCILKKKTAVETSETEPFVQKYDSETLSQMNYQQVQYQQPVPMQYQTQQFQMIQPVQFVKPNVM